MQIPYEIGQYFYWLEPVYWLDARGTILCREVRLYNKAHEYKGIWMWPTIPSEVRLHIRSEIRAFEKKRTKAERIEQVRTRSMIGKTK